MPLSLTALCCPAVGLGEGVVLPSMNSLVATQVAPALKARALGTVFTGFHCGNLVGLALSPGIIAAHGWPSLFLSFGLLGAPLLALWQLTMPRAAPPAGRSPPAAEPSGGRRQRASVGAFLRHPAVLAIVAANFVNHWGYFIYLSWIPSYFSSMYGLNLQKSSFMAFVPWIAMAVGSSLAGVLADALVARWPVRFPRTLPILPDAGTVHFCRRGIGGRILLTWDRLLPHVRFRSGSSMLDSTGAPPAGCPACSWLSAFLCTMLGPDVKEAHLGGRTVGLSASRVVFCRW